MLSRIQSEEFEKMPLPDAPVPVNRLKAGADKALALLNLALASPLWLAVVAAQMASAMQFRDDRGPLFYAEERISQGKTFRLLKFRIVRVDVLERVIRETGAFHVCRHQGDANCTRLGRLLKKFYLDEMPQMLNVLRGDMSFVGPRPRIPEEYEEELEEGWMCRKLQRTGLTGLVQIHKGSLDEPLLDRRLDNQYLRAAAHLSPFELLLLDLEIMWSTLRVMLRGEGL